jgi:hypothetical protein
MTDDVFTADFTKTFDKVSEKYDNVMLGQSLSPQLKFLIFWQWLGLFIIITSKSDGSAIFVGLYRPPAMTVMYLQKTLLKLLIKFRKSMTMS